jgi:hypothetical protein
MSDCLLDANVFLYLADPASGNHAATKISVLSWGILRVYERD